MSAQLYKTQSGRLFHAGAIAIITVGKIYFKLPARGKTHLSRSLKRYLRWVGVKAEVFHVGDYRRKLVGSEPNDFFDPGNQKVVAIRKKIVSTALNDMVQFFLKGGQVGIFDASNTIRSKRQELFDKLVGYGIQVVFVESICDKPEIIEANILGVKVNSPDYKNWDPQQAKNDFERRIDNHLPYYETLGELDSHIAFIKIINLEQIVINRVKGYLETRIIYYLMNLHITPRSIYFVKTSACHLEDSKQNSPRLSEQEVNYAKCLRRAISQRRQHLISNGQEPKNLKVWTSTGESTVKIGYQFCEAFEGSESPLLSSDRSRSSSPLVQIKVQPRKALVQIEQGVCLNLTENEIKLKYPDEYEKRKRDVYRHRYPRAESYLDLAVRLEPIIMELEREKDDVIIIAHESVLQCLYGYFFDKDETEIPYLKFGYDKIVEVIPSAYGSDQVDIPII